VTVVPFETNWLGGNPGYTADRLRLFQMANAMRSGADPMGPVQGIIHGGIPSIAGLRVTVPQSVFVLRHPAGGQGAYTRIVETPWSGMVAAQPASGSRIDVVFAAAGPDPNTDDSQVGILTGVVGAAPSPPALPESSLLLGTVTVPTSGNGAPTITSGLWYSAAPGAVLPWPGARGNLPPLRPGQLVYTLNPGYQGWQRWATDGAGNGSLGYLADDVGGDASIFSVTGQASAVDNQIGGGWTTIVWSRTVFQSLGGSISLVADNSGKGVIINLGRVGLFGITLEAQYPGLGGTAHAGGRIVNNNLTVLSTPDEAGPYASNSLKVSHYHEMGSDGTAQFRAQTYQTSGSTQNCTPTLRVRWLGR